MEENKIRWMAEEFVEIVEGSGEDANKVVGRLMREEVRKNELSVNEIGELMVRVEAIIEVLNDWREANGYAKI